MVGPYMLLLCLYFSRFIFASAYNDNNDTCSILFYHKLFIKCSWSYMCKHCCYIIIFKNTYIA